jgi:hypothetical protein
MATTCKGDDGATTDDGNVGARNCRGKGDDSDLDGGSFLFCDAPLFVGRDRAEQLLG